MVPRAAEALRKKLECSADLRLAEEIDPEAELVVLRESPLGQVCGTNQKGGCSVSELGEHRLCVKETRAFTDDSHLKFIWKRRHQCGQHHENVRRIEVLSVEREN